MESSWSYRVGVLSANKSFSFLIFQLLVLQAKKDSLANYSILINYSLTPHYIFFAIKTRKKEGSALAIYLPNDIYQFG